MNLIIGVTFLLMTANNTPIGEWMKYKIKYRLKLNALEDYHRMKVFFNNMDFISKFNSQNKSFSLALNIFSHWNHEEYLLWLGQNQYFDTAENRLFENSSILNYKNVDSEDKDWRTEGKVGSVQYQGDCSAAYALAASSSVESMYAIKSDTIEDLSAQEIVDCTEIYGNSGCKGGSLYHAFRYVKSEGIFPAIYYPYREKQQVCQKNKRSRSEAYKISSIEHVSYQDEKGLSKFVSNRGPVAVAIDASPRSFQFYHSGIYDSAECNSRSLNHHAVVVGIGSLPDFHYILKNSFSECWGEKGYMRLKRYDNNMCGVATSAMMPIL